MTKASALYQFFSSFGLPAYATTDVSDDAENRFRVVMVWQNTPILWKSADMIP